MGNQQETIEPSHFELGWLVAAIEGEGLVGIYKCTSGTKGNISFKPTIKIYNTDTAFVERCMDYYSKYNIPFHVRESKPRLKATGKEYKSLYTVDIQGYKRCAEALKTLRPSLFAAKRDRMEALEEFVKSRLATPMTRRNNDRGYSEKEVKLISFIRSSNLRGKGSRILNDYTLSQAI